MNKIPWRNDVGVLNRTTISPAAVLVELSMCVPGDRNGWRRTAREHRGADRTGQLLALPADGGVGGPAEGLVAHRGGHSGRGTGGPPL